MISTGYGKGLLRVVPATAEFNLATAAHKIRCELIMRSGRINSFERQERHIGFDRFNGIEYLERRT